jgi:NADH-quinone oxidoreductase subunit C
VPAFAINAERDQLVTDQLGAAFGARILALERQYDMLCVTVSKDAIHEVLDFLKDKLDLTFLTTLCGMHYADRDTLGLVIHLQNMRQGHRIRVKTETPLKDPVFPTFTDLWPASNWMEREAYDFFGLRFTGHPDLRRILNMEDFPAFPLRKDYPLEDPTREDKDDSYFGR